MSNIQNGLENNLNKKSVLRWLNSFDTATTINKEIIEHRVTAEHCYDLVVQSDKKFKIFPKTEANPTESAKNPTEELVAVGNKKNNSKDISKEILDESSFKIQCKIEEKPQPLIVNTVPNVNDVNIDFLHESNDDVSVKDLQTLLIMMAISSKTNNTDDVDPVKSENPDEKQVAVNKCAISITSQQLKTEKMDNILNITPIKITLEAKHEKLARKYLENWREYIRRKKDYFAQQRELTLNKFLGKLTKKKIDIDKSIVSQNKAKLIARDYSTYQHRYKMQKHVIAFQKAKLEEQNRLIEELKYNKILEASRDSVNAMKDEIKKTYFEIDRHLKPKIKCLTNELKIPEIDASALVLQCLKVPQFLQRMEKRAREREEKHAIIRERRRQMEEERIRLKQQAELAKAEMDKEEKIKRMKELREKRKREKIENIRKKQFAERMRALTVMADLYYEKHLLSKYGIQPLKKLLEIKKENTEKADVHYKFQLKKNVFLHFMWYTEDMWFERTFKAVEFYRKTVLRKAFEGLKKNHHDYILKKQVAEDYYDLYVTQLVFRHFKKCTQIFKKENELKLHKAVSYHNWNIIFKAFTCWRTLPALNALKREQEARKARWREKVLQVVPDYAPPDD